MSANPHPAVFDDARAEAFAGRMIEALNLGSLCLLTSLGHRTGLFDALAGRGPSTSAELAEEAGLDERYVREWLAGLTMARVVEHDPADGSYFLPAEHAAFLTRAATPDNIAVFAQYVSVLGGIEDEVVECFRNGGGVPYERFSRFHEVMAEDSGQTVLGALFEHILPLVPELHERLESGIDVLDAGCGRGRALMLLAGRYPASRFMGYDLSGEAITHAREEARAAGLANLRFEVRDLTDFDRSAEPERFDFVTSFDAVHDQASPLAVLTGIRRTLRPGGLYLMQDIHASSHVHENLDHPVGTMLYTVSTMHCMTVSLAQGGEGLGTMWGRQVAEKLLREAGFDAIEVHRLAHDFQNDFWVLRV
jgi:SAM-dependent methyltransferase